MSTREAIEAHARRGEKLLAIKFYRQLTGESLAESKRAVEEFMEVGRWRAGSPLASASVPASASASVPAGREASRPIDLAAVALLLSRGEKIEAIKALREMTGWGLAATKAAVDAYCVRRVWGAEVLERAGVAPGEMPVVVPPEVLLKAEVYSRRGEKIAAIKALREVIEIGLKDAKDAVERFVADGAWPREVREARLRRVDEATQGASGAGATRSAATQGASGAGATTSAGASGAGRPAAIQALRSALTPAGAAVAAALLKQIGGGPVDAIHEVEKDFARGYLAVRGERAFFLTKRFAGWEVEREYRRSEGVSAEVRVTLSRVELRLRKSFVYDSIHGLDEETARAIGRLLDERFEE